jgi:hypothetical protein
MAQAAQAAAPPPPQPWRRLLALNILVLLLVLGALCQALRRHPLLRPSAQPRRAHWELRGAARSLLHLQQQQQQPPALPPARQRPSADGLTPLWDPVCQLPGEPLPARGAGAPFVELCVSSELSQRLRRDAIRAGYGRYAAGLNASLRFFVGQPEPFSHDVYSIESERRRHGDVVILPFRDSYENLTLKTLAMLSYAAACGGSPYVAKLDDDVMVYLARLRRFLEKMDADAAMAKTALGMYAGTLWVNTPPIVAKGNKNEESKWVLAALPRNASEPPLSRGKFFFPYAGGPFYLMSRAATEFLQRNAHRLNWKWRNEDMAVGTCACPRAHRARPPPCPARPARTAPNAQLACGSPHPPFTPLPSLRLAGFIGADIETINTFQVKVLHWRWSTKPFIALHNIDDRHRIAEWHVELGNSTLLA